MKLYFPIVLAIFIFGCNAGSDKEVTSGSKSALLQAEVDALVSSNPRTTGECDEELPASWSEKENCRVWEAYYKLVKQEKAAVPVLVGNLDRQEFSTYISSAVSYSPLSVGDMCQMAIQNMFDPIGMTYKSRENLKGEHLICYPYFDIAFKTKKQAEKWWEQNKDKTIPEIQKMIWAWYIDREISFGFNDEKQKKKILDEINRRFSKATGGDKSTLKFRVTGETCVPLTHQEVWGVDE